MTSRRTKETRDRIEGKLALINEHFGSSLDIDSNAQRMRITDTAAGRDLSPRLTWAQLDEWLSAFMEGMTFMQHHQRVVR